MNKIEFGDCRDTMRRWAADGVKVQTCVTSPPYFGLRDYGHEGQIGLEQTPEQYIAAMVEVFRCVRDVLADDGTLWLNIGDSYSVQHVGRRDHGTGAPTSRLGPNRDGLPGGTEIKATGNRLVPGLKPKDLIGIPWMLAFALRADGWYLRQDIIWCLSGGAWVYARTQKGDMPVMVKDLVRLDPATVKLWNGEKWTQVLGWGESNDTSQRIELVLRSGERIGCTGGHLWPTQRGNVAARDLQVGDTIQTCRLPEPANTKRPEYLTDGLLWLIGLYLAEGSRSGDTIQLSLHGDEKHWTPLIDMAAEQVGATITYHDEGDALHVRMYGRVLNAVFDEYIGGKTAIDKHLTTKAWMLPNDALRMIAQGYLNGDGHDDGSRIRLGFCRNYALERDLRTLAARLGATLTLNPCEATYQGGKKPAFRGEWRWERSGHHSEKDRGEIIEIRASRARQFWDIAVEDEPHLFALASGVLTHNCKPNPMPESVRDRCTKAHEYVFLLSKSERYFYDHEAIKEPEVMKPQRRLTPRKANPNAKVHDMPVYRQMEGGTGGGMRNRRSVWTVATRPYKGAHFATFPPALIEPCILAGSLPVGAYEPDDLILSPAGEGEREADPSMTVGRAGWNRPRRDVEAIRPMSRAEQAAYAEQLRNSPDREAMMREAGGETTFVHYTRTDRSGARAIPPVLFDRWVAAGWLNPVSIPPRLADPHRSIVLDPFMGSGTTAAVALQHGRQYLGCELNPEYGPLQDQRIANVLENQPKPDTQMPLNLAA